MDDQLWVSCFLFFENSWVLAKPLSLCYLLTTTCITQNAFFFYFQVMTLKRLFLRWEMLLCSAVKSLQTND